MQRLPAWPAYPTLGSTIAWDSHREMLCESFCLSVKSMSTWGVCSSFAQASREEQIEAKRSVAELPLLKRAGADKYATLFVWQLLPLLLLLLLKLLLPLLLLLLSCLPKLLWLVVAFAFLFF